MSRRVRPACPLFFLHFAGLTVGHLVPRKIDNRLAAENLSFFLCFLRSDGYDLPPLPLGNCLLAILPLLFIGKKGKEEYEDREDSTSGRG